MEHRPPQKIGFLFCYFGHWPWYFKFFLKSCAYNLDIDFIILTDNKELDYAYDNVKLISSSLKEVNQLATDKLGFQTKLLSPYKLCDFKPLYGFLFDDILEEYDFWGHGDIDLVFGKIRDFITIELLEEYDVISVRNDYPSGFFMLYRNTPIINTLFKESKDYQKVFSSNIHYCFDECNFQYDQIEGGLSIFETNAEIESMMHVIKRADEGNKINAFFDFFVIEGQPGKLKWDKGVLSYKGQFEVLLYHFITIKTNKYFQPPKWSEIPDIFYIENTFFSKYSKKSILGFMLHFLKKSKFLFEKFQHRNLIRLNHLLNIITTKNKASFRPLTWEGIYSWGAYDCTVSTDQNNNHFLNFGKKEDHLQPLIPLFRSNDIFTISNFRMIIQFEKQTDINKMILKTYRGDIQQYTCKINSK